MRNLVKVLFLAIGIGAFISVALPLRAQSAESEKQKVIVDTDFSLPPQDDSMALMLAIKAPNLELLGVTTVAGNDTVQLGTSNALRELEIAGRTDVAVYRGANKPLVHENSDWTKTWHERCCRNVDVLPEAHLTPLPPGGFAKREAEKESAVDFIIRSVNANPKQVTIIALGPLTNVAMAIRQEPGLAQKIKRLAIMGGVIGSLPDGGGNAQPNAEFNFWVDPEAAHVVLRSGIPITLTPLNVTHKTSFSEEWFDKVTAANTPLTNLMKDLMTPSYGASSKSRHPMHDQLTVAAVTDPSLVKTTEMFVDVDINHGPDYGVSVGWTDHSTQETVWPGSAGAQKISVQYDVDNERFMKMFYDLVTTNH
jgi:inosine-uridine nucleoside N-ribohydrolase